MQSLSGLVKPLAVFVPDSLTGETFIILLALLVLCALVGMMVGTHPGQSLRQRIEESLVARLPGYALFRSLAEQVADGRYTVFVPSVPTPLAGAVYILDRARVHPVDVPLTQAMKVISHWGQGSGNLVAAMQRRSRPGEP